MGTIVFKEQIKRRNPKVPDSLIYEKLGRRTLYYRGYKDVLAGRKTTEEIMGCSDIQGAVVAALLGYLYTHINRKAYLLTTNEVGLLMPNLGRTANDIAIFDRKTVTELHGKYFKIPPKVVIEFDIKVDVEDYAAGDQDYIWDKTDKLLAFGVERVIWITTTSRKVFVANRNEPWITQTWADDVTVLQGCILNLAELLREEGITF
jgi:Uma2 family endonuclease